MGTVGRLPGRPYWLSDCVATGVEFCLTLHRRSYERGDFRFNGSVEQPTSSPADFLSISSPRFLLLSEEGDCRTVMR